MGVRILIVGQELMRDGDKVILTNHLNFDELMRHNYEEKKIIGKGFTEKKKMRKFGCATPSLIQSDPLLREGLMAEMQGDDLHADRCYRLFFRLNPQFRCSEGSI